MWKYSFYLLERYSSYQVDGASNNLYHSAFQERSVSSYRETSFEIGLSLDLSGEAAACVTHQKLMLLE